MRTNAGCALVLIAGAGWVFTSLVLIMLLEAHTSEEIAACGLLAAIVVGGLLVVLPRFSRPASFGD